MKRGMRRKVSRRWKGKGKGDAGRKGGEGDEEEIEKEGK
jgi:hypothetical protein